MNKLVPFSSLFFDDLLSYQDAYPIPNKMLVEEDNENYFIKAIVPGFDEKEMNVSVRNNRITVSGKKEKNGSTKKDRFYSEYSSFEKSYSLPQDIIIDNISAEYKAGVLLVILPKRKITLPETKNITIKYLDVK